MRRRRAALGSEMSTMGQAYKEGAARDGGSIRSQIDRCGAGSQTVSDGESGYRRQDEGCRLRRRGWLRDGIGARKGYTQ